MSFQKRFKLCFLFAPKRYGEKGNLVLHAVEAAAGGLEERMPPLEVLQYLPRVELFVALGLV